MMLSDVREFYARTDLVVLYQNGEYSDMDNPEGNVYGYRAYVLAEAADGSRWRHFHGFSSPSEEEVLERAGRLADRIAAAFHNGVPLNPELWSYADPVYLSPAYFEGGEEERQIERERMEDY